MVRAGEAAAAVAGVAKNAAEGAAQLGKQIKEGGGAQEGLPNLEGKIVAT